MSQKPLAVIYCRVSSQRQVNEGDGLGSQESRCREFAEQKGYAVLKVFADKGVSGALTNRPAIQEMLEFISSKDEEVAVIIDDISRIARDVNAHLTIKAAIKVRGGRLESPSMKFGEEPEDDFMEVIFAGAAELQRKQNAKQVKNRMRARLLNGFWVFAKSPLGYQYGKHPLHGKVLVKIEGIADIVAEALEGFASDRFLTQVEVQEFLNTRKVFRDWYGKAIRLDAISKTLKKVAYAGYVQKGEWNVPLTKAFHEPLITLETHQKIVDKIAGKRTFTTRNDEREDFPLRGLVLCGCCDKPMTASWAKGKTKRHPYYHCANRGSKTEDKCEMYGKSIRRADVHDGMSELLSSLTPSEQVLNLTQVMVGDIHKQKARGLSARKLGYESEMANIDAEESRLLSEYIKEKNLSIKNALKNEIERQQFQQEVLKQKLEIANDINVDIEEDVGTLVEFIRSPQKIWDCGSLDNKKTAFSLIFGKPIAYSKIEGFGTPSMSLPYRVLGDSSVSKDGLVV